VIRLFHVYYPARALVLLAGEVLIIWTSFLLGTALRFQEDTFLVLNYEYGYYKILAVTALVLVCAHWGDLYDPLLYTGSELYFRLLLVIGSFCFLLAGLDYAFPHFSPGKHAFFCGLLILTVTLAAWRAAYVRLIQQSYFRERVYFIGSGSGADRLARSFLTRNDLGIELVGRWDHNAEHSSGESLADHLLHVHGKHKIHRVIVAVPDRRGTLPMHDLLQLRLKGVKVEDATSWLEKISGKIEVEGLYPSWLIFSDGFRLSARFLLLRRVIAILVSVILLTLVLPLIPLVILAIKFGSPGPIFYRQKRVGRYGVEFNCYKFRTMRADAEADVGPTWASDDDPRITRVGRFLRRTRLDEIPQLWNVFIGDMGFVGPRPERPEFVGWLSQEIPYYPVRHVIRPGITGWAQIRYKYGNSVAAAKEKLQYDLFYLKNISLGLDALIMFETVKTVLLRRGAN